MVAISNVATMTAVEGAAAVTSIFPTSINTERYVLRRAPPGIN